MSELKPIGFLQEDFHSEVLDFLCELVTNIYPNRQLNLYNDKDKYNNKDIYKEKYRNFNIKRLEDFIPDMTNKTCEKIIVVSYDNIFHLRLLQPYTDHLIFIAHSDKHVYSFKELNMNYFTLTSLLSKENFMLPILKTSKKYIPEKFEMKPGNKQSILELKSVAHTKNLTIIMTVGYFLTDNKNFTLIRNLLKTRKILLLVYTPELSNELYNLILEFPDNVFTGIDLNTSEIKLNIEMINIKYLLFAPPNDSLFYKSSWSGSIAFAFDNDLHIIMPTELADLYNLNNGGVVVYDDENDIDSIIDNLNKNDIHFNLLQESRNSIYNRNEIVFDTLLQTNFVDSNLGKIFYKNINYKHTNEFHNLTQKILNEIALDNGLVIDTSSEFGIFSLIILNVSKTCKVINFEKDIDLAKIQKKTYLYNNVINRVKIYNNHVGNKCQRNININHQDLDMISLDSLEINNQVRVIKMDSEYSKDIMRGSKTIIGNCKPIIIIKGEDYNSSDNTLYEYNYTRVLQVDQYSVYRII